MLKVIKDFIKLDIDKQFKNKILFLGIMEMFLNSYKIILKLIVYIIGLPFVIIGKICETVGNYCMNLMIDITNIKDITLLNKEDKEKVLKLFKEKYIVK